MDENHAFLKLFKAMRAGGGLHAPIEVVEYGNKISQYRGKGVLLSILLFPEHSLAEVDFLGQLAKILGIEFLDFRLEGGILLADGFQLIGEVGATGTEGEAYRFLRRYGVVCFFGFGYLAQLVFLARLRAGGQGGAPVCAMLAVALLMLALGLANVATGALVDDGRLKDRIENVLEWHLGWLLAAWYLLHAWLWRRLGVALAFAPPPPRR